MGTDDGQVQLYPHTPKSLLSLLERHLPYCLPVYGTIKTNDFPSTNLGTILPNDDTPIDQDEICSVAWTTFPEDRSPGPEDLWTIMIHLPPPQTVQTRFYCSAEKYLKEGTSTDMDYHKVWRQGQDLVNASIKVLLGYDATVRKIGALNLIWNEEVLEMLDKEVHEVYDIWIAPLTPSPQDQAGRRGTERTGEESNGIDKTGLMVDECFIEDCEIIQSTRDIKENINYYKSRLNHITVIRPIKEGEERGEAVTWVMNHADGNLGALYTVPGYRKRGLARWVIRERLDSQGHDRVVDNGIYQEDGEDGKDGKDGKNVEDGRVRGHAWTSPENEASVAVWKSLGWEKGWQARWVYV